MGSDHHVAVSGQPVNRKSDGEDHYHCPRGCEHPQPFRADNLLLCGHCWFFRGWWTVMAPCGPEFCA